MTFPVITDPSLRALLRSGVVRCPMCYRQMDELDACSEDIHPDYPDEGYVVNFACRDCFPAEHTVSQKEAN